MRGAGGVGGRGCRLDFDTAAVPGWNTHDAVRVSGSLQFPPGMILPDSSAATSEINKVIYEPLDGVYGTDSFAYSVTDCLEYGAPTTISVELPTPRAALIARPFVAASVVKDNANGS